MRRSETSPMRTLRVGIAGCGVVGSGVARILLGRDKPWEEGGARIELVRAANLGWKGLDFIPKSLRAGSIDEILADTSIDVVVELVGGTNHAKRLIESALRRNKHVVTANKALLAEHGNALFREAKSRGLEIAFEAAVAGSIPVLDVIQSGFAANRVRTLYGILNGTTNYILSRMSETGDSFGIALAEAQKLGFAEADPTLDIEGIDAAHKLQLITALAYKKRVPMSAIPVRGIRHVDPLDIAYARELGYRIKLLAVARMIEDGLEMSVAPTLVAADHPLAAIRNEVNAVFLETTLAGPSLLVGKGAGSLPTGSAIVADLIKIARGSRLGYVRRMAASAPARPVPAAKHRSRFYLRLAALERPGVLGAVTTTLGKAGISIASVVQLERQRPVVPIALLTHDTTLARIQHAIARINRLKVIKAKPVVYPLVD